MLAQWSWRCANKQRAALLLLLLYLVWTCPGRFGGMKSFVPGLSEAISFSLIKTANTITVKLSHMILVLVGKVTLKYT